MPKAPLLPTNDAIFLDFLSRRPGLAHRDLNKITPKLSPQGKTLASKILGNKNPKYRKPVPDCTEMISFWDAIEDIDKILEAVPLFSGGSEAVMGYLKYVGVLNSTGGFRKSS
jgi:hypothetical protein